jgi:hypothetical protein
VRLRNDHREVMRAPQAARPRVEGSPRGLGE